MVPSLSSVHVYPQPVRKVLLFPFCQWRNWSTGINFPKVRRLVRGTQSQILSDSGAWAPNPSVKQHSHLPHAVGRAECHPWLPFLNITDSFLPCQGSKCTQSLAGRRLRFFMAFTKRAEVIVYVYLFTVWLAPIVCKFLKVRDLVCLAPCCTPRQVQCWPDKRCPGNILERWNEMWASTLPGRPAFPFLRDQKNSFHSWLNSGPPKHYWTWNWAMWARDPSSGCWSVEPKNMAKERHLLHSRVCVLIKDLTSQLLGNKSQPRDRHFYKAEDDKGQVWAIGNAKQEERDNFLSAPLEMSAHRRAWKSEFVQE